MAVHLRNVAIVGAGGQSGSFIANALIEQGKHTITAITRHDSNSKLPAKLRKVEKVDYNDHDELVKALTGQDVLVITMGVTAPRDSQRKLIDAAKAADVKWVMPNEWGGDYSNEEMGDDVGLGPAIVAVRRYIEEAGLNRLTLACGFWYEFSLSGAPLRFGFDFKERTLVLYDGGKQKISLSTWPQVGNAVAKLLALPVSGANPCLDDYKNGTVYIESFFVSQLDMFESVKRVTDTADSDWKISQTTAKQRFQEGKEMLKAGDWRGMGQALYARVFYPDEPMNFHQKTDNGKLGLAKEELDQWTKVAVDYALSGKAAAWS